jgi:hypothetical protein
MRPGQFFVLVFFFAVKLRTCMIPIEAARFRYKLHDFLGNLHDFVQNLHDS